MQAVIAEAGDSATVVESRRLRPGFTAFGQTQWSLQRQAQFAAHLPGMADSAPVMALMRNLADAQRWGIAADGAAAKGGWAPHQAGGYLVRQFGAVSTGSGQLGVALAALQGAGGTLETGVDVLNRMMEWLTKHTSELPGGSCAPPRP